MGDALLDYYFCYSVFNIIDRSVFMRDMALGGPMFSEFLLMTMYTSATSKIDSLEPEERINQERLFSQLAKEYLTKEMEGPTKITTIQGLLLLSGRECATGNVSQGWNHAGLIPKPWNPDEEGQSVGGIPPSRPSLELLDNH